MLRGWGRGSAAGDENPDAYFHAADFRTSMFVSDYECRTSTGYSTCQTLWLFCACVLAGPTPSVMEFKKRYLV